MVPQNILNNAILLYKYARVIILIEEKSMNKCP